MIEIIQMLYAYTPIELRVIILACLIGAFISFIKIIKKAWILIEQFKNVKTEKKLKERL